MTRAPLLAILLVTGFFAYITGVDLAFVVVYAMTAALVTAAAWSWWAGRRVRLTRSSPPGPFVVGERFQEEFRIENRSRLPLGLVELRDRSRLVGYEPGRALTLTPRADVTCRTEGRFAVRGRHQLGPAELRLADPLGLFPRAVRCPTMTPVLVYPRLHELPVPWMRGARSGRDVPRGARPSDRPPTVAGIREHDPGDGLRRIHWLESARRGRLISRRFDADEGSDVLVVLDCQAGVHAGTGADHSFEVAVALAGSVARQALRQGRAVALLANDRRLSRLPAAHGPAHGARLLEWLALATDDGRLELGPLLHRHLPVWRGRGPLVVVTGARDPSWVEAIALHSRSGERPLAIYVDPATFGGWRPPLRVPPRWRLVVDLWLVRRGDDLDQVGTGDRRALG